MSSCYICVGTDKSSLGKEVTQTHASEQDTAELFLV